MPACDESVEISVHWFAWPVPLRPREVGGGAPVERGHGQNLPRGQAVELAGACVRDEVLEAGSHFPPSRPLIFWFPFRQPKKTQGATPPPSKPPLLPPPTAFFLLP